MEIIRGLFRRAGIIYSTLLNRQFILATFSGDVATFPVGSVSATFSGAATFLGMKFPIFINVATYKIGYIFWQGFLATFPGVATFLVVTPPTLRFFQKYTAYRNQLRSKIHCTAIRPRYRLVFLREIERQRYKLRARKKIRLRTKSGTFP